MTLSSQENLFLLFSYFRAHPTTLLRKILGERMHWPSPHLKLWGDRPPVPPRFPPLIVTGAFRVLTAAASSDWIAYVILYKGTVVVSNDKRQMLAYCFVFHSLGGAEVQCLPRSISLCVIPRQNTRPVVIVNSTFLQRPQKLICGNQLIHRHFPQQNR